jgi:hypothetical protein
MLQVAIAHAVEAHAVPVLAARRARIISLLLLWLLLLHSSSDRTYTPKRLSRGERQ